MSRPVLGCTYRRRDDDNRAPDSELGWALPILAAPLIQAWAKRQGELLRQTKAIQYTCGLGVVIVGLGLNSYYVRELLASLALFAGAFFILGLVALGVFLVWCTVARIATWTPPVSRSVIAFSRRFIAAYAKS